NFLWGAAFSHHQTEGKTGGGENGDWFEFSNPANGKKSPIENGDTANVAVDFWNRYPEDITIARDLSLNTLRTSVSWEKIEPRQGEFNQEVMDHYKKIFAEMKAKGLRPMISFHHFTHPKWFHQQGGWLNPKSAEWYVNYTRFVVQNLKEVCDLWMSFNEPMVLVQMGYLSALIPPMKASVEDAYEAAWNTARAHLMVVEMVHSIQGVPDNKPGSPIKGVGLAYAFSYFEPHNKNSAKDKLAVQVLSELVNWAWLDSIQSGRLEFKIPKNIYSKTLNRDLFAGGKKSISPKFDWIGLNYYSRWLIKYNPLSKIQVEWVTAPGPKGDNGWQFHPEGLGILMKQVTQKYPYPLIISENGMADASDAQRQKLIVDAMSTMDSALKDKIDLRGYYHWSLMDNFEWLHGYRFKFGLVEIDFKNNLKRMPRKSGYVYRHEISKRPMTVE
ncbi:MAG: family 1 glycosylhydrolase, partial [Bdellovibrionales bacterium]|nr:family 1 glycosylhydrolase [Bdellovibrionales bacterium]